MRDRLVRLRNHDGRLAFAAPPLLRDGPVEPELLDEALGVLGIGRDAVVASAWVDNGPGWVGIELADADAVAALRPASAHHRRIEIGVVGRRPASDPIAYDLRAFFTDARHALLEDPVTGSLNAAIAGWMIARGVVAPPYVAAQGAELGRAGRIHIDAADGKLWIGGNTVTRVRGTITLD